MCSKHLFYLEVRLKIFYRTEQNTLGEKMRENGNISIVVVNCEHAIYRAYKYKEKFFFSDVDPNPVGYAFIWFRGIGSRGIK